MCFYPILDAFYEFILEDPQNLDCALNMLLQVSFHFLHDGLWEPDERTTRLCRTDHI
jgi:hypothetical protein